MSHTLIDNTLQRHASRRPRDIYPSLSWSASRNRPDVASLRKDRKNRGFDRARQLQRTYNLPMWLLVIIFNAGLMSGPRCNLYLAHSPVLSQTPRLPLRRGKYNNYTSSMKTITPQDLKRKKGS